MPLKHGQLESAIFHRSQNLQRFTQDSPIYPDVWREYCSANPDDRVDLLFTPHRRHSAGEVIFELRNRLRQDLVAGSRKSAEGSPPWRLATTGDAVAAELSLRELLRAALPLTNWWRRYLWSDTDKESPYLAWLKRIVAAVTYCQVTEVSDDYIDIDDLLRKETFAGAFDEATRDIERRPEAPPCLWSVSLNRRATCQMTKSIPAIKADASRRLFNIDGAGIVWAVIDSGIDARHPAFRSGDDQASEHTPETGSGEETSSDPAASRVIATYDFTAMRAIMGNLESQLASTGEKRKALRRSLVDGLAGSASSPGGRELTKKQIADLIRDLERALKSGRLLDWSLLAPLLRVPHGNGSYRHPAHPHGTHVAGILGADTRSPAVPKRDQLVGVCPGIELFDLRVMGDDGQGDEFTILAALQFVRWLNSQSDKMVVHGVNLSFSIPHKVANFACGRTPVCEECERLVAEGTVVVAAAGNQGRAVYLPTDDAGPQEGFRAVSITDPGNAEAVITVGSTHRSKPHTYGVSYFSSRGPTGDGRAKPDILAPGEKVVSCIPGGGEKRMDGTSMAAPHVSGAAALLLAQHRELIGQPRRVKEVLCESATDLGRERYFQGHGMLDTLRALQSL